MLFVLLSNCYVKDDVWVERGTKIQFFDFGSLSLPILFTSFTLRDFGSLTLTILLTTFTLRDFGSLTLTILLTMFTFYWILLTI